MEVELAASPAVIDRRRAFIVISINYPSGGKDSEYPPAVFSIFTCSRKLTITLTFDQLAL
jgi:hypothetical protein